MSTNLPPPPEIRNRDMLALRAYITAPDPNPAKNASVLVVDVTHSNLRQRHLECRFGLDETLYDLRLRIYQTTGTPPRDQHLQLFDRVDSLEPSMEVPPDLCVDNDDQVPLLSFFHQGVQGRVHCVDTNPHSTSAGGALENVSLVPKFRLSEEEYEKRRNTLRAWAKEQKAQDPKFTLERHAAEHRERMQAQMMAKRGLPLPPGFVLDPATGKVVRTAKGGQDEEKAGEEEDPDVLYGEGSVHHAVVGMRCEVTPGGRRGVVRWSGRLPNKPGFWVGVDLDEPVGQNDGSLDGVRYFDVPGPRHGSFVRGPNAAVGDYPERDLLEDSEEDDDSDGEM
jgi:tubulin-specific chaperone B